MYKYTIQAYNQHVGSPTNIISVIVTAPNELGAIEQAKTIVQRECYAVIAIEVIANGVPFKKQPSIKKG